MQQHHEGIIHGVLADHADVISDYHKLRTRKSGPVRYIDLPVVVPRGKTVEEAHFLSHLVSIQIRERLANSQVLVYIEPFDGVCDGCHVDCRR